MSESKHTFTFHSDDLPTAVADNDAEEAMLIHPHRGRRKLTPADYEHNRNVRTLFNNIIPGLPIDADPPEVQREPESMESMITTVMKKLNIDVHEWIDDLRSAWKEILPPDIAERTQPAKFENNILFVNVISSIVLFELRRSRLKEIETAVRRFAPDKTIRHVQLVVNHVPI